MPHNAADLLIRSLSIRDDLQPAEAIAIRALPFTHRTFERGETLVRAGVELKESCLIVEGLSARVAYSAKGDRQFTSVHVPAEFVDLHGFLLKELDHDVVALGNLEAAFVSHAALLELTQHFPHLARLLWLLTLIDAAIHRAWLNCVGRKSPQKHIAHLMCEIYIRLQALDLAADNTFELPVTQTVLSDMLALSLVHVNRSLQDVRALELLTWSGQNVHIHDFERLAQFGEFDPMYLNLVKRPR